MNKTKENTVLVGGEDENSSDLIIFFCYKLNRHSELSKFAICTVLTFAFFIVYGYLQELIFQLDEFKPYGMYLTLIQFILYSLLSFFECQLRGRCQRKVPLQTYAILAFLTVGTIGMSNSSVGYLNYPTQVVFKCCKLIPVLIGGIIIQGKKYGVVDFLTASLMSIGITLFTLADIQLYPSFNLTGIVLISLALVADAAIGNLQEKVLKQYSVSNSEMVFYSYSIGSAYIFMILFFLGHLTPAFTFCAKHPLQTYGYGALFSFAGYCGVHVVLILIKSCGAFVAVTITTCRKAVTIILSFVLFSKPFSFQYVWSGTLVAVGIYLNLYRKQGGLQYIFHRIKDKVKHKVCYVRQFYKSSMISENV